MQPSRPAAQDPRSSTARFRRALDGLVPAVPDGGGRRERIEVRAPFDGRLLGSIPRSTPADVERAVTRARAAQAEWATRPVAERARVLLRFHDLLLERQAQVLDLIQLEAGKARLHASEELMDTANVARYYASRAERLALRAERQRLVARSPARAARRLADPRRDGQRQRGVRRDLGLG